MAVQRDTPIFSTLLNVYLSQKKVFVVSDKYNVFFETAEKIARYLFFRKTAFLCLKLFPYIFKVKGFKELTFLFFRKKHNIVRVMIAFSRKILTQRIYGIERVLRKNCSTTPIGRCPMVFSFFPIVFKLVLRDYGLL